MVAGRRARVTHRNRRQVSPGAVPRERAFELIGRRPSLGQVTEDQQAQQPPLIGRYRQVVLEPQGLCEHPFSVRARRVPLGSVQWVLQGHTARWSPAAGTWRVNGYRSPSVKQGAPLAYAAGLILRFPVLEPGDSERYC